MFIGDLYESYASPLRNQARRLVADGDSTDDLVQETFIRALGHLELLESLDPPKRRAWLYRTMRNLFLDKQRARQRDEAFQTTWRRHMKEEAFHEAFEQQMRTDAHPVVLVSMPEIMKRVPEKYRDLLHKRYVLGMTSEEIAKKIGVPAATVRSRLHIAIKKLRTRKTSFL